MDSVESAVCSVCSKAFSALKTLRVHVKKQHPEVDVDQVAPSKLAGKTFRFQCELCNRHFQKEAALKFHVKSHAEESAHSTQGDTVEHVFTNFAEFLDWKKKMEKETVSSYVKEKSCVSSGKTTHYFRCHRSGTYVPKGNNQRHLKLSGSCKIGGTCPAHIKVVENDEECVVTHSITHEGHVADEESLKHLHLTEEEKLIVAKSIQDKIPFHDILDRIRESLSGDGLFRIHLLDMKDLHNIEQEFQLDPDVRHRDDATSVQAFVNEMNQCEDSCVVFYKAQGVVHDLHPGLAEDDFVLIIQNHAQQEMLLRYGRDCICIDGTHGTNQYNFELTTVLVLDELRQGFPCAFFITNRTDTATMSFCLEQLRSKSGPIHCSVFMSDMAPALYNSWVQVMDKPDKRLFCSWHVDKAWRTNITKKVKGKEKQVEVYKKMRTLIQKLDIEEFKEMFDDVKKTLLEDSDTLDFGLYIVDNYDNSTHQWAYCYRMHSGLNTNMHLERMHRTIKYVYLKGKNGKRLDKTLGALMAFLRDRLFSAIIEKTKGKLSSKISDIRKMHVMSESLNLTVNKENDGQWKILSHDKGYIVRDLGIECSCKLICIDCNVCIHKYICTCYNSAIKWTMCKHVHAVAMTMKPEMSVSPNTQPRDDNFLVSIVDSVKRKDVSTKKKEDNLAEFLAINNSTSCPEEDDVISKCLATMKAKLNAVRAAKSCSSGIMHPGSSSKRKAISPQKRLHSTKKARSDLKKNLNT